MRMVVWMAVCTRCTGDLLSITVYPLYPSSRVQQPEGRSPGCQFCRHSPIMTTLWHKHMRQVAAAGCVPVWKDQTRDIHQGPKCSGYNAACGSVGDSYTATQEHAACQQIGTAHKAHNVWRANQICLKRGVK